MASKPPRLWPATACSVPETCEKRSSQRDGQPTGQQQRLQLVLQDRSSEFSPGPRSEWLAGLTGLLSSRSLSEPVPRVTLRCCVPHSEIFGSWFRSSGSVSEQKRTYLV